MSVRDAEEAVAALEGGATLIDVKEPSRGPLGAADVGVICEVVGAVGGRAPVSAAMGEMVEAAQADLYPLAEVDVNYVKWGPAGTARLKDFPAVRQRIWRRAERCGHSPVTAAYADSVAARAIPVWPMATHANAGGVFLVDTFTKDGGTLLDHIDVPELLRLRRHLHAHGIRLALAGSLGEEQIAELREVEPDWFAVRGAACEGGRGGVVTAERVRRLAALAGVAP